MSTVDDETTLLSGTLAVQTGLASREAVAAAMRTWADDRGRTLTEILTEQGTLSDSRRHLLEALTREVLTQHDGDPHRSLGSLTRSFGPTNAPGDETVPEDDPDRTLGTEPAPSTSAGAAGGPPSTLAAGQAVRRFRIIRPHARGGLGEVYLAADGELNREVALKEIQDRHADRPDSRSRFLLEAEITGGLEHPGIVPVYGLGTYGDGRPYYAMRFIRGDSMKEAIAVFHRADEGPRDPGERALALRELLGRFIDVCQAIEYAHARRVLHRDLKPGNVMLGRYGETLVVDWGLAKPLDRPDADPKVEGGEAPLRPSSLSGSVETMQGAAVGTPQYMSPEQAAGRLDELGPASDIYSLGGVLYTLLTGRPPVEAEHIGAVLVKVREGDLRPPRSVNPRVPAALDAICRKAMALRPEDRYPSARSLADDVEHWLADEPVSCHREPWPARLARWARRHRTVAASAAVLTAVLVPTLAVANVLIARERDRAARARDRAEESFRVAEQAVDGMLTRVGEVELADVPQMERVRDGLLREALRLYQDLLGIDANEPALRAQVARAEVRLGEIRMLLGGGDDAARTLRRGIAGLEAELAARPGDVGLRRDLARARTRLGELLKRWSRFDESEAELRAAVAAREAIAREFPASAEDARLLADARYQLGTLLARLRDRRPEDEAAYRGAIEAQRALIEAGRDRPEVRADLARSLNNLALLLRGVDDARAEEALREAGRIFGALAAEAPTVVGHAWRLARVEANLATLLVRRGAAEEARAFDRDAFERFGRLAAEFPGVPEYRQELASMQINRSLLRREAGDPAGAEESAAAALGLLDALAEAYPGAPLFRQKRAAALFALGQARLAAGRTAEADDAFAEALKTQDRLVDAHPEATQYRLEAGNTRNNLGVLRFAAGDLDAARRELERARTLHGEVSEAHPGNAGYRRALLNDHAHLAAVELMAGDDRAAAGHAEAVARLAPGDREELRRAARFLALAAARAIADGRPADAGRHADRALGLLDEAVRLGFADPKEFDLPAYDVLREREEFRKLHDLVKSRAEPKLG